MLENTCPILCNLFVRNGKVYTTFFFFNTFPLFLVITFADTSLKSILSRKEKNRDSFLFLYGDLFKLYTMTQTREKSAKKKKKQNPQ